MSVTTGVEGLGLLAGVLREGNPQRNRRMDNVVKFYVRVLTTPINVAGGYSEMVLRDGYVPPPTEAPERRPSSTMGVPRLMFMGRVIRANNGLQPHIYLPDPCSMAEAGEDAEIIEKIIALHTMFISEQSFSGVVPNYGDVVSVTMGQSDFQSPELKVAQFTEIASLQDSALYSADRSSECRSLGSVFNDVASTEHAAAGLCGDWEMPEWAPRHRFSFKYGQLQMLAILSLFNSDMSAFDTSAANNYGFSHLLNFIARPESGNFQYDAFNRGVSGDSMGLTAAEHGNYPSVTVYEFEKYIRIEAFPWWEKYVELNVANAPYEDWQASEVPPAYYLAPVERSKLYSPGRAEYLIQAGTTEGTTTRRTETRDDGTRVIYETEIPGDPIPFLFDSTSGTTITTATPPAPSDSVRSWLIYPQSLSTLSVWDVRQLQRKRYGDALTAGEDSSEDFISTERGYIGAAGKFQVMPTTHQRFLDAVGLTEDDTKNILFDAYYQTALGIWLCLMARKRLGAYLISGIDLSLFPRAAAKQPYQMNEYTGTADPLASMLQKASGDDELPHNSAISQEINQSDYLLWAGQELAYEWTSFGLQFNDFRETGFQRCNGSAGGDDAGNPHFPRIGPPAVAQAILRTALILGSKEYSSAHGAHTPPEFILNAVASGGNITWLLDSISNYRESSLTGRGDQNYTTLAFTS